MFFGERIKLLRIERKWTQEYVCEKLNISSGALSRYETGMYEPKSLELIKDFATLFEVSTDYLLGKSDIRNPEKIPFTPPTEIQLYYDELNETGKQKAIENVRDLTKIQEYTYKNNLHNI